MRLDVSSGQRSFRIRGRRWWWPGRPRLRRSMEFFFAIPAALEMRAKVRDGLSDSTARKDRKASGRRAPTEGKDGDPVHAEGDGDGR